MNYYKTQKKNNKSKSKPLFRWFRGLVNELFKLEYL